MAKAGRTVRVRVSWSEQPYSMQADRKGHFELRVATPAAGYTPLSITFDDGEALTINDVLAGDVWVCGGQSNMQMPVLGFANAPAEGDNRAVVDGGATARSIRYLLVTAQAGNRPIEGQGQHWLATDPERVPFCSAVGYYFAREVNRALNIPIGLVLAYQGGTAIQCWLNDTTLRSLVPDVDRRDKTLNARRTSYRETAWCNGTFHPIHRYTGAAKNVWLEPPLCRECAVPGDEGDGRHGARFFDNDYRCITPFRPEGFEVAGADRVFHPARAYASEETFHKEGVLLTCAEVKHPVAVRYNYHDAPTGNARNGGGLPIVPFRTDDWDA